MVKKAQNKLNFDIFKKLSPAKLVILGGVLFVCIMLINVVQSQSSITEKERRLAELDREYAEQQMLNDEMQAALEESDEERMERVAREKLDFVLPGERVFVNSSGN